VSVHGWLLDSLPPDGRCVYTPRPPIQHLTDSDLALDDIGREHGVKHVWAYMLFGQLVAISVATNLFLLALAPSSRRWPAAPRTTATVPPILWLSVLASLVTVFLVPHSLRHDYFLSNLLAMHVLVVIPLIPLPVAPTGGHLHIRTRTLYLLVGLLCFIARARTVLWTKTEAGAGTLWAVLNSHPAQASIGWDVVWTTVAFLVWVRPREVMFVLGTGIGTIGTSMALYFYFLG
jgi:hypothetical protein